MDLSMFKKVMRLNNKGVLLLDAGRHEEAIAWFKTASKQISKPPLPPLHTTPSDNTTHRDANQNERASPSCSHASTLPKRLVKPGKPASLGQEKHEDDLKVLGSSPLKRQIASQSQLQSQKRPRSKSTDAKPRISTSLSESANYVIGRPWWLTEGHMSSRSVVSLSSILLYNLGLNYHLQGLLDKKAAVESKMNLKRAMGVYQMAQRLAWKAPGPILLLSLHNMSQIHFHRGNDRHGHALSREVCKILRVLHVGIDGYEKYYLRMLSLQSRILAPAA
eukprot:CAMPEP_0119006126 /NCGR_PEP_ID=MMETSP1176-20130426/2125_1 /TAXON_ID=265551 /ORGANISM="Synedropsis recta cf, Strain CCMP1620" /LENGTH=276 /DNA_ID=CAMNT_0006958013 /DNA_START=83 /DNA_END=913 /DNA_ORIENTATION=+